MTLFRFYWQQLVTMEVVGLCYSEISPVWRNWQTQQTQNLPGITPREGSIPFTGTKNCLSHTCSYHQMPRRTRNKAVINPHRKP